MHDQTRQTFPNPLCRGSCSQKENRPLLLIRPPELDRREVVGRVDEAPIVEPAAPLQPGYLDSCSVALWVTMVTDRDLRHHHPIGFSA